MCSSLDHSALFNGALNLASIPVLASLLGVKKCLVVKGLHPVPGGDLSDSDQRKVRTRRTFYNEAMGLCLRRPGKASSKPPIQPRTSAMMTSLSRKGVIVRSPDYQSVVWMVSRDSMALLPCCPTHKVRSSGKTQRPGYSYELNGVSLWPSRDPIEEEGGLNLYRFVRNCPIQYFDKLGLETGGSESTCETTLAQIKQEFTQQINWLRSKDCDTPISCECCEAGGLFRPNSFARPGRKVRGSIVICYNNTRSRSKMRRTLGHELVHAMQSCAGYAGEGCDWRVCMEIQAYFTANCGRHTDPARKKECVRGGVKFSTYSYPGFNDQTRPCKTETDFDEMFERNYEKCAKIPTIFQ